MQKYVYVCMYFFKRMSRFMCIESDLSSHNVLEEIVKSQNIIVWDTVRRRVWVGKQIINLKVFSQNVTHSNHETSNYRSHLRINWVNFSAECNWICFATKNNMFTRDKRRALGPFLNLTIWLIQDRSSNSSIIEKQQRNFKTTLLSSCSLLLIQLKKMC